MTSWDKVELNRGGWGVLPTRLAESAVSGKDICLGGRNSVGSCWRPPSQSGQSVESGALALSGQEREGCRLPLDIKYIWVIQQGVGGGQPEQMRNRWRPFPLCWLASTGTL